MRISTPKSRVLATSALASLLVAALPAAAQEQTASDAGSQRSGNDTIVVTAQFREQNLQDTPLAITAVTGEMLESKGATTVLDVATTAPNVTMRKAGGANGGAAQVFVRGVGQSDASFAFEPGVGMYIDDVYYGTVFGSIFDLLDLDRVEVLRGPQGTLAGKNSIGGAVKLFSTKPTDGNSGYVEAAYGSFDLLDLKGMANFTLVPDKLMVRVSGMSKQVDGWFQRYDYGCLNPGSGVPSASDGDCSNGTEGGRNYQAGRLALRFTPNEDMEFNLVGMVSSENSEVSPQVLLDITQTANIPAGIDPKIFITPRNGRYSYANYTNPAFTDPARYNGVPGAGSHPTTVLEPEFRLRAQILSNTFDWKFSDSMSLKSITSYQHYRGSNATDIDLTPFGLNTVSQRYEYDQFTQELRFNGTALNELLEYTVGGFYFRSTGKFQGTNYLLPGTARQNLYAQDDRIPSESKSVFAHVTAYLTDSLTLIGGIRYTADEKKYEFRRRNPYDPSMPSYTQAGQIDGLTGEYSGDSVDYRANLQYRWSPDVMTYIQFSTGYRGGGVNPRPYVLEQLVPFEPERLNAYEAGFKADLLGRAVRLNGSVFLNKYTGILFNNQTSTPNSIINATPVNAGDARFVGAELEVNLRPIDGLSIDASGSYLAFEFERIGAEGATISDVTLDNRAPFAPEWKGNIGIQYEIDAGDFGFITPRFDLAYTSSFFPQIDNDPRAEIDGYALANARIGWENVDGDLQVALLVTNLFDEDYLVSALRYPLGVVSGTPSTPREWKVSVRKRF
ncbi:TonB-dependent receptor [Aurantiacibacter xanthus]|uniref:TonB-dependent receptor n=1 Tax=Aurantiacibacter xanthus TaxID=1784712 RepID=A0A3A1NZQ1_9SPHN|nr:TonB-dependent receptor [Aurantiacibacter xanthus]RIV80061.1 TonB-dependent receptor [Aurantiacibacter xanthus]